MIYSLPFSLKSLDWLQKIQKWQDKQELLSIELTVGKGELPKKRERERETMKLFPLQEKHLLLMLLRLGSNFGTRRRKAKANEKG